VGGWVGGWSDVGQISSKFYYKCNYFVKFGCKNPTNNFRQSDLKPRFTSSKAQFDYFYLAILIYVESLIFNILI
jgi:hypothetical protein